MSEQCDTFLKKKKMHIKKYGAAYILSILFLYCFTQMPLHYDQLVSVGLYTRHGGLINYLTGYCWYWVTQVNGRFISTLIGGFLEQNYTLMFLVDAFLIFSFPVLCMKSFSRREKDKSKIIGFSSLGILLLSRSIEIEVLTYACFIYIACMMFIEAKTPCSLSFYFVSWFNTTQILWTFNY